MIHLESNVRAESFGRNDLYGATDETGLDWIHGFGQLEASRKGRKAREQNRVTDPIKRNIFFRASETRGVLERSLEQLRRVRGRPPRPRRASRAVPVHETKEARPAAGIFLLK